MTITKNQVNIALAFVAGVAAGAFVTYKYLKGKYDAKRVQDIHDAQAMYDRKCEQDMASYREAVDKDHAVEVAKEADKRAAKIFEDFYGHRPSDTYEGDENNEEIQEMKARMNAPTTGCHLIEYNDYGSNGSYPPKAMTLYKNGVLVDNDSNLIVDVDEYVGNTDFFYYFGESSFGYPDDTIVVRNEDLGYDLEIWHDRVNEIDINTAGGIE